MFQKSYIFFRSLPVLLQAVLPGPQGVLEVGGGVDQDLEGIELLTPYISTGLDDFNVPIYLNHVFKVVE